MGTQQYLQGILQIIIQGCDAYNLKIKSNQTLTLAPDQINILSPASNTNEKVGSRDEVLTSTCQAKKEKKKVCIFIYKYMYSKTVFLEYANDRMQTDKTKMQICKKEEGWTLLKIKELTGSSCTLDWLRILKSLVG